MSTGWNPIIMCACPQSRRPSLHTCSLLRSRPSTQAAAYTQNHAGCRLIWCERRTLPAGRGHLHCTLWQCSRSTRPSAFNFWMTVPLPRTPSETCVQQQILCSWQPHAAQAISRSMGFMGTCGRISKNTHCPLLGGCAEAALAYGCMHSTYQDLTFGAEQSKSGESIGDHWSSLRTGQTNLGFRNRRNY